jgi:phosphate transport system substrate-binding protein
MQMKRPGRVFFAGALAAVSVLAPALVGCSPSSRLDEGTIRITGSDTMVNLTQAWAEAYRETHPDVATLVRGGGSGVGIAALLNNKVDIAPCSRAMTAKELALAKEKTGKEPKQFIVGQDALAIYVHKDNPIEKISMEELAEIYGEGGNITRWDQLGVDNALCASDEIVRVSRQNASGTYAYFREAVLGDNRQYKQGTTAQSGSADLVKLVSNTPCALGYSGMGYRTAEVKLISVSRKKGGPAVAPTLENALNATYPLARPLYLYTLGEPTGAVQEFIEWALGPAGQKIVADVGFVPNAAAAGGGTAAPEEKPARSAQPE